MDATAPRTRDAPPSRLPSPLRQLSYFVTGGFAGAATLPVEMLWARLQSGPAVSQGVSRSKLLPHAASARMTILRAGTRFWVFDITRSQLNCSAPALPVPVIGALSGAAGGAAEVCVESLASRKGGLALPAPRALWSQSAKLFFCFGTYTFLSRAVSPEVSRPTPFALCWALGAVAGGFGSAIVNRWEGVRGLALWRGAVPRGAIVIGTVISVHVTSCAALLDWVGEG